MPPRSKTLRSFRMFPLCVVPPEVYACQPRSCMTVICFSAATSRVMFDG